MKKNIFTVVLLIFIMCAASASAHNISGKELYPILKDYSENRMIKDGVVNGWINGGNSTNKVYFSDCSIEPKEGESYKLFAVQAGVQKGEMIDVSTTNGVMPCVDVDNSALQLWLYSYGNINSMTVGLTCWGMDYSEESTGYISKFSAISVPIRDYADVSENSANTWQLVTIPLKDIKENGIFNKYTDTQMTEFDWYRISGLYVSAVSNGLSVNENIAGLDDVKIISYLYEPKDIDITEKKDGSYIEWKLPAQADGTVLYKDGEEIKRFGKGILACDVTAGNYELQSYTDDGMYSAKRKITVGTLSDSPTDSSLTTTINNAGVITDGKKNVLVWDKDNAYSSYYIYNGTELVAKTSGHSVMLDNLIDDKSAYKCKVTVIGRGTPGNNITVMVTNNVSLPFISQKQIDANGEYRFEFIVNAKAEDCNIKLSEEKTPITDINTADKKAENYSWSDENASYIFEDYVISNYSIVASDGVHFTKPVEFVAKSKSITISDYMYEGSDGTVTNDCTTLDCVKNVIAEIKNDGQSRTACIAVAVYNKDTTLKNVSTQNIFLSAGKQTYSIDTQIFPLIDDDGNIKIFLLSDNYSIKPLTEKISIQPQKQITPSYSLSVLPENYQTIKGWGLELALPGTMEGTDLNKWNDFKTAIFDNLGITMTRVFLGSEILIDGQIINYKDGRVLDVNSTEIMPTVDINKIQNSEVDYSTVDKSIPLIKCAVANGLNDYLISIIAPPRAMLECGSPNDGLYFYRYYLRDDCIDMFADTIVKELNYITEQGIPAPKALSLQNEPENGLEPPQYSPELYKKTLLAIRTALNNCNEHPEYKDIMLVGPETSSYANIWASTGDNEGDHSIDIGKNDPVGTPFTRVDTEYADNLDAVAVHSYLLDIDNDISFNMYANDMPDILKYKDRWQTEFSVANAAEPSDTYEMDVAKKEFQVLCGDVDWAGNNVWMHWLAYYDMYVPLADRTVEVSYAPVNGELLQNNQVLGYGRGQEFYTNKTYDMLSMIFKNVPVGSTVKRVSIPKECGIKNESSYLSNIIAFENGDSSVVAILNDTGNDLTFDFNNMKGKTAECFAVLNEADSVVNTQNLSVVDGNISGVRLPADSIVMVKTN